MVVNRMSRTAEVENVLLSKLHELAGQDGRLPTEAEIAEMFGVSRTTVRSAVGALVARGLVVRRQGMGSFVSQAARIANPLDEALDFSEIIKRNLCCPTIRHISSALVTMDESLATLLNQSDRMALRRHTLFSADGDPVIYCINTIPLWVLPDNLTHEVVANPAISEPLYDFLAQHCNQRVELSRATVWPDLAAQRRHGGTRGGPAHPGPRDRGGGLQHCGPAGAAFIGVLPRPIDALRAGAPAQRLVLMQAKQ